MSASHTFCLFIDQSRDQLVDQSLLTVAGGLFAPLLLTPQDAHWTLPIQISEARHVMAKTQPVIEEHHLLGWIVTLQDVEGYHTLMQTNHKYMAPLINTLRHDLDVLQELWISPQQVATGASWRHQLRSHVQDLINVLTVREYRLGMLQQIEQSSWDDRTLYDLAPLVQDVVGVYAPIAAKQGIALGVDLEPVQAQIVLQPFTQALHELVANAMNFTPDGGSSEVRMHAQHNHIVIEVCDTGAGIPQSNQTLIFEPFYRVERPFARSMTGCGVGLAIARAAAHVHDGFLGVESVPGHYSCFTLLFPLLHGTEHEESAGETAPATMLIEEQCSSKPVDLASLMAFE